MSLKTNKELISLDLTSKRRYLTTVNSIDNSVSEIMLMCLEYNKTLLQLSLYGNDVSNFSLKPITRILKRNRILAVITMHFRIGMDKVFGLFDVAFRFETPVARRIHV